MAERLHTVQARIRETLDPLPPGPVRVISACAGDGRDLVGALRGHPRARDVSARLVERSPTLVAAGRRRAARAGLDRVEFRPDDAGNTRAYAGAVPADIVLFCGVFGNIRDRDVQRTICHAPELTAPGGTVIWTRGRFRPDLTPRIRRWFRAAGFEERAFVTIPGSTKSVGAHRLAGPPRPFRTGLRLFTFLPRAERPSTLAGAPARSISRPGRVVPARPTRRRPAPRPAVGRRNGGR